MSLYGAMFSGVSGLQAQSSALGAISDNISNVNTTGYKGTNTKFSTLVTKQVALTKYSPGGVQSAPRAGVDVQGLLNGTTQATDIAISGKGFFIVNQAAHPGPGDTWAYSRAGSFKVDNEGYLVNTGGYYLQAWPTNNAGELGYYDTNGDFVKINPNIVSKDNLRPINLSTIGGSAAATRNIELGLNLPQGANIGDTVGTDMEIHDSFGSTAGLRFNWTKEAMNAWDLSVVPPKNAATLALHNEAGLVYAASGRIDLSKLPAAGETLDIDGATYTFVNGAPATANQISLNTPTTATVAELAKRLQNAINLQQNGSLGTTLNPANTAAADSLTIGGVTIALNNRSLDDTVALINAQTASTGVKALNVAGRLGLINTTNSTVAVTGTGATHFGVSTPLAAGANKGQRYVANGEALEITQTTTGSAIAIKIPTTASWTPQAHTHNKTAQQGEFTVEAVASDMTGITFNKDGILEKLNIAKMAIEWSNGSADMVQGVTDRRLSLDLGTLGNGERGLRQLNGGYTPYKIDEDGAAYGDYIGVSIAEDGTVMALFDNGETRRVFKIPVATFTNPNGMEGMSGNAWIETEASGGYTLRTAGDSGAGAINSAALEGSTVDLGEEFTNMIVTQRAYSASAKIITTADEMLDELIRIKR